MQGILASKEVIPPELRRKVSPAMVMFAGVPGLILKITMLGISGWTLYLISDHNAVLYVLGSFIAPVLVATFYTFSRLGLTKDSSTAKR